MANIRLFVAVEISEEVRHAVAKKIEALREIAKHSRFVSAEKLHLTLQFLGWVDDSKVTAITEAVDRAARAGQPLTLHYEGGGAFGSKKSPRVLWVGVSGDLNPLRTVQRAVELELQPLGFEPEKREYSPHLTLARAKQLRGDRELVKAVEALQGVTFGDTRVKELILMQSLAVKGGSEYRPLHRAKLG